MYNDAVENKRGSFTPIIATCEGIHDREAEAYYKHFPFTYPKNGGKLQSNCILDKSKISNVYFIICF